MLLVLLVLVVVRHVGDVRRVSVTYAATAAGVEEGKPRECAGAFVVVLLVLVVVQLLDGGAGEPSAAATRSPPGHPARSAEGQGGDVRALTTAHGRCDLRW
ncbi:MULTISPECIES: hypothetical protein [Streptomyces]|uniref:hypothetical protein n=1 Tax=Streptomyces TaxID=1883 RepID=UPI003678F2BC